MPSPRPRTPQLRVVELAAAQVADAVEHLLLAVGEVLLEPVLEERRDGPRQAQHDEAGAARAGVARRGEDLRHLVIGDRRDDRRDHHADRDAGLRQRLDRARRSSGVDVRGSMMRASFGSSVVIETTTDAALYCASSPRRSTSRVTRWFFVMMADRIAELGEHVEAAAGDLQLPLDRLVGVGHAADGDHLRLPLRRRQLLAQQLRRVLLDQDLRLEVEAGGEAEVLVRGAGEAVDAAVLAAAIRVDAGARSRRPGCRCGR